MIETKRPFSSVLAGPLARFARESASCARWTSVTDLFLSDATFTSATTEEIVDFSVAVVVFFVADLWICGCSATFDPLACFTYLVACVATSLTRLCEVVIDASVTVVIYTVTLLCDGCDLSFALSGPFAVWGAGLASGFTRRDGFCRGGTAIARLFGARVTVAAFIDTTVTIVVFLIAALFCGGLGSVASLPLTGFADLISWTTLSFTGAFDLVVDDTVAVVVDVVTDLRLWELLVETLSPSAVDTDLLAVFTDAFATIGGRTCEALLLGAICAAAFFVDSTVTVVVLSIASFSFSGGRCLWNDRTDTASPSASNTRLFSFFTRPFPNCTGWTVVTRTSLTIETVACGRCPSCRLFLDTRAGLAKVVISCTI